MATVDATMLKVQRILAAEFSNVMLGDGGFSIERGSTRINVVVKEWGKDPEGNPSSIVRVWAPIAREVPQSPELYRWAAVNGSAYLFGSVTVFDQDDKKQCLVVFDHSLLADYLDPAELCSSVAMIGNAADELDDIVHEKFGGKRYTDA